MVSISDFTVDQWNAANSDNNLSIDEFEGLINQDVDANSFVWTAADPSAGTLGTWSFSIGGQNFRLDTAGKLEHQKADNTWEVVQTNGADVNFFDGLSIEEAAAFAALTPATLPSPTDPSTPPVGGGPATNPESPVSLNSLSGRKALPTHRPKNLYDKMLYTIANQMNDMFLDILDMSTVLANGTGLRGILMLAEKGIVIDGVPIANILTGTNGQPIDDFAAFGKMFESNVAVSDVTAADGTALEGGDVDSIIINLADGPVTLDLSNVEGLTFNVTPPNEGDAWSIDNINVKLTGHESILESPGTLFLIQQLLQQMKDAMQAVGAVGKVAGDVRTTGVQSFVRDMNG